METDIAIKLTVAGEGAVGKTTLLHRYVNGYFLENIPMTVGLQFFTKELTIEKKRYKIIFWDVGGQLQFRELHKAYIGGTMGAILMFDLTRLTTLNNINKWIEILREDDKKMPILLVGSKYDLIKNEAELDNIYQYASDIIDKCNLFDYIVTSSKIGYNIDNTFSKLLEKVQNRFTLKSVLNKIMDFELRKTEI